LLSTMKSSAAALCRRLGMRQEAHFIEDR